MSSRAYIENERIVDSAFTSPLFQLVIAEFSEDYLPEIIGMTLYLEWAVVAVKPQVAIMESLGIDPMFYSLHIGIDNSVTGHGAMAKRTAELYLDEVRASSGDKAMQEVWSRIWDGYVAFATTGGLGEDFRRKVQQRPNPGSAGVRDDAAQGPFRRTEPRNQTNRRQLHQQLVRRTRRLHAGTRSLGLHHPRRRRR